MAPSDSDRVAEALSLSHAMQNAAKREDWPEALRFADMLMSALSDGKGHWSLQCSVEQSRDVQNLLLNLQETLERMQFRRSDLRALLGDVRNQQRLRASYRDV